MGYGDFTDFTRRTDSDKRLHDKAFNIAKNPKCDGYRSGYASINFLIKKTFGGAIKHELAEELHKAIIGKFNKRKVYSFFIDNIFILCY